MSKIKVVVIDDDEHLLESTKTVLELNGDIEVKTANSADEGIKLLRTYHPDVALIDIVMPEKWGDDVAATIKHDDDLKDIAFSFFTGSRKVVTTDEVRDANGVIGGNTFTMKGIDPSELRKIVLELADQRNKKDKN